MKLIANEINDKLIIKKVIEVLDKLKDIDLNNKSTIKCINTQIMSMLRYYIGSVVFSINCLERIDTIKRNI